MVPAVQPAHDQHLQHGAKKQGRHEGQQQSQYETVDQAGKSNRKIRADHVKRSVREVHQIHDAEHQRQPRGQQEQQQPELDSVQALLNEEDHLESPDCGIRVRFERRRHPVMETYQRIEHLPA